MRYTRNNKQIVKWIGSAVSQSSEFAVKKTFYREFVFGSICGKIGDFVLVSNADSADPDTVEGCDVAEILQLFESKGEDPYNAKVRWYSRPTELPTKCVSSLQLNQKLEVVQDNRSFDDIVSIETFFSSCQVIGIKVDEDPTEVVKILELPTNLPVFVCRYKLANAKRLPKLEPFLQTERISKTPKSKFCNDKLEKNSSGHESVTKNPSFEPDLKMGGTLKTLKVTLEKFKDVQQNKQMNDGKETEFDELSECSSSSWIIKKNTAVETNFSKWKHAEVVTNETVFLSSSIEFDKDDSMENRSRPCSPIIPIREPSLMWHGVEDEKGSLKVLKLPIKFSDTSRSPLKSIEYENSQIPIRAGDEIVIKTKEKNVLKSKRNAYITKLKSEDISQLLEQDDDENGDDNYISDLMEAEDDDSDPDFDNRSHRKNTSSKHVTLNPIIKNDKHSIKPLKMDSMKKDNKNESVGKKIQKDTVIEKENSNKFAASPLKNRDFDRTSKLVENSPSPLRPRALKDTPSSPRVKALKNALESPRIKATQEIPSSPRLKALKEKILLNSSNSTSKDSPKSNDDSIYLNKKSVKKKLLYEDSVSDIEHLSESSSLITFSTNKRTKKMEQANKDNEEKEEKDLTRQKRLHNMVQSSCSNSRRRKREDSDIDYESDSNIKRIKIDKKISKSTESPKVLPSKLSQRIRKPNRKYDDDWDTSEIFDSPRICKQSSPAERSLKHKSRKTYDSDLEVHKTSPKTRKNKVNGESFNSSITPLRKCTYASPRTPKSAHKLKSSETPKSKKKGSSVHLACLTPSIPDRSTSVSTPNSALQEARARLHVSAVPKSLPCREKEFDNIYYFLLGKIHDGTGGCMYISGVPGTGKTATVQEVVRTLQNAVSEGEIPDFQFIELNGMKLTEPRQAYVQLLKQLTGQTVVAEQAQQLLERRFTRPAPKRITTLLLVDELDLLWTRRQDVVYNLLDWPTKVTSRLVVLTIANTMDLPERLLMGRVTSRLGLTRITFHPYSHKQLQEIVMARLAGVKAFDPDAVQLVARKVAAVSGDARRALDICRRATELAEIDDSEGMVEMKHVDQALVEMVASTKVQAIRFCSKMEQLFLQAVAAEVQRTGVEETSFYKVHVQLRTLCTFDGHPLPSITEALGLCSRLGSCRLLITEHSRTDIYQRVLLNVSSDDIHYALKLH